MFKSKIRPMIIPQFEHARVSAKIASMWGNDRFDRPEINFEDFVGGVALHDWQYGTIDNLPLGEVSESDWLAVMKRGVALEFSNPTIAAIAKIHMKRLISNPHSPQLNILSEQFESKIADHISETPYSRAQFEWADAITRFCDSLAFDFAFEAPTTYISQVYAKVDSDKKTKLTYNLQSDKVIEIDPWPFSAPTFSGMITGYHAAGYPESLIPEIIQYQIKPKD